MKQGNVIRQVKVSGDLSPTQQIVLALAAAGYPSVAAWARGRGYAASTAWAVIVGRLRSDLAARILEQLAADVGRPLAVIHELVRWETKSAPQSQAG